MNHTCNAGVLPRQTIDAAVVLELVRKNGFHDAEIIYWDQDNPECGYESLTELMEDCGEVRVTLGISLNAPAMIASREWLEGEEELGPVILRENDQAHPTAAGGTGGAEKRGGSCGCSVLLADMQRCLLWMEHVNRCAEREEKMGHWLSNWSDAMNHWDAEYQKARDAIMSANSR